MIWNNPVLPPPLKKKKSHLHNAPVNHQEGTTFGKPLWVLEQHILQWKYCKDPFISGYRFAGFHPKPKPCTCPASRPKSKPRVSNRDFNSLMNGGTCMSEAGPGAAPHECSRQQTGHGSSSPPSRRGRLPVIGKLISGWLFSYQESNRRMPLITPLISIMESSDPKLEQAIATVYRASM